MRRLFLFTLFCISIGISAAQDYYWYKNQKIFLEQGDEQYVLFRPNVKTGLDASAYLKTGVTNDSSLMWGIQKKNVPLSSDVKYVSPSYSIKSDSSNMYVTERFYVKLKQKEDYDVLVRFATEHNVTIVKEGAFSPWYVLACTEQSDGNALQMANLFYESSLFAVSEPEFINAVRFTCVNENNFYQQWNLLNTGQYDINHTGLDINYCGAHAVTNGVDSIIIAVVDEGIAYHLDLSVNFDDAYDASSMSNSYHVYGDHGTKCAGIIGAQIETGWGIAGIAPYCPLLPISFSMSTTLSQIALGIKYAADYGASVINNSWISYAQSNYFDSIVNSAIIDGRNGKGCVVVFAAGNDKNNTIAYPANSNPNIIAVGAMNPSAERAIYNNWGSNYGHGLDVMAPGVNIPTTIPQGYMGSFCSDFWGTSAACPHIAAVAGLVLSVNPNLTQKEVADIIESTAQKVGNYNYDSIAPNGTWNMEMGYGLVDAYAAVKKAQLSLIEIDGSTYLCDTSCYFVRNVPDSATIAWHFDRGSNILYDTIGVVNADSILIGKKGPSPIIPGGIKGGISPGQPLPPYATLSVTVSKGGISYTKEKRIFPKSWGHPNFNSADSSQTWPLNTTRLFDVLNCEEVENKEHLIWTIYRQTPLGMEIIDEHTGDNMLYTLNFMGWCYITVTNTENPCGNQSTTKSYFGLPPTMTPNNGPARKNSTNSLIEEQKPTAIKFIRNGQLFILHKNKLYNAEGALIR